MLALPPLCDFERGELAVGDLRFPYHASGPTDEAAPLLLCLHGFPDSPQSFGHQLRFFGERGYRVVAPCLRGYAPGCCPPGPYQPAAFAGDVVGMLDALGRQRAIVYGHDWGTAAAQAAALLHPSRVSHLITAAVPYGPGLARALLTDPAQQRRSWYVFFFQTPLAELSIPHDDYAFIDRLWQDWSPGGFPRAGLQAALQAAKDTLRRPGVLPAALAYYRTAMGTTPRDPALQDSEQRVGREPIMVPSLYVHGADDGCIAPGISEGMEPLFGAGLRREVLDGAGHFVHLEAPDRFNRLVLDFLGG